MFGVSAAMFQALFQMWKAKKEESDASRRRVVVQRLFSGKASGADEVSREAQHERIKDLRS
jgi:hypothetical protein